MFNKLTIKYEEMLNSNIRLLHLGNDDFSMADYTIDANLSLSHRIRIKYG